MAKVGLAKVGHSRFEDPDPEMCALDARKEIVVGKEKKKGAKFWAVRQRRSSGGRSTLRGPSREGTDSGLSRFGHPDLTNLGWPIHFGPQTAHSMSSSDSHKENKSSLIIPDGRGAAPRGLSGCSEPTCPRPTGRVRLVAGSTTPLGLVHGGQVDASQDQ